MAKLDWTKDGDSCFNGLMHEPTRPTEAHEVDWRRYGVAETEFEEQLDTPPDELLVARFMAGETSEDESSTVRDRLRRFASWRDFVAKVEAGEWRTYCTDPKASRPIHEFIAHSRRELVRFLQTGTVNSVALLSRTRSAEDLPGGPPVDELLVKAALCDSPPDLEAILLVSEYSLRYREWRIAVERMDADAHTT